MIIYQGQSLHNGEEIAIVAACLDGMSRNMKTGPMAQVYTIPVNRNPLEAIKHHHDEATCGSCHLREGHVCYAHHGNALTGILSVWSAFHRGAYGDKPASQKAQKRAFRNRYVRLGAYGNSSAAPFDSYKTLLAEAAGITCYIHDWATADSRWSAVSMASVSSLSEMQHANELGYRTFRVAQDAARDKIKGEKVCLYEKSGNVLPCIACLKCNGQHGNIVVSAHGSGKNKFDWE